jgi:hypothetical protein
MQTVVHLGMIKTKCACVKPSDQLYAEFCIANAVMRQLSFFKPSGKEHGGALSLGRDRDARRIAAYFGRC